MRNASELKAVCYGSIAASPATTGSSPIHFMHYKNLNVLALGLLWVGTAFGLRADVVPASLFQDHAVLQREKPVPVWGRADAGEKVTVVFAGQRIETVADAAGAWSVTLAPLPANASPATLTIVGKNTVTLSDIVVGEVWLASGQSNMEWAVKNTHDADLEARVARFPLIREFKVAHAVAETPAERVQGAWVPASPKTVGNFSAVAYHFAKDLHLALDVPVGIINSSWGGTRIESWMSPAALASDPAFAVVAKRWQENLASFPAKKLEYDIALAAWKTDKEAAAARGERFTVPEPRIPPGPGSQHAPSSLHHGMIAPLAGTALRGVIWYQGESNARNANEYAALFTTMIRDWRAGFGQAELPFFWAQLAAFAREDIRDTSWAALREAQAAALALPATGQVIASDASVSDRSDIHPRNKLPIGRRFSRLALNRVYGDQTLTESGPVFAGVKALAAAPAAQPPRPAALSITFARVKGKLRQPLPEITGLEIAGEDGVFHPATALLDGDALIVHAETVPAPVAVRYAWKNYSINWLQDDLGLPVAPFQGRIR